ncbi:MAG: hypothetical protein J5854_05130 [Clostridia bacterium]|nr:hypothetical protein [Clostridia bacterium]
MIRTRKSKRSGTRVDPRFFIIIGILVAVIGVLLFILLYNGKEEITDNGAMTYSFSERNAVLIRDEKVLMSAEYARLDYLREEGEEVITGEKLATVYKLGYSDELMQSLLNARENVYRVQMDRIGSTKDARLDEMNEAIAALRARIEDCVMLGSGENLEQLYWQLESALKERMDYLRDKVQETETLRALYKTADDTAALLETWTETIYAPSYGVVSYYFDGYEEAMNAEKLSMLTPDLVNRAIKDKGSAVWTTGDRSRACRVVDNERWFLAFLTKSGDLVRTAEGVEYDVEIKGYGTYRGVALDPIINGSQVVNILEFDSDIGELLNVRTASVRISAAVSGIKVKSEALKVENGITYIELLRSESHITMRVDVLAEDNGTAIIRPHEKNETLSPGVRYWNRKR